MLPSKLETELVMEPEQVSEEFHEAILRVRELMAELHDVEERERAILAA
jgi:hypothetical protein